MKGFITRPYRWMSVFTLILTLVFTYALLHTFVIPRGLEVTEQTALTQTDMANTDSTSTGDALITSETYEDDNIKITIETVREYETTFYVADIQVSNAAYLQTAFAQNEYGKNIKESTSDIAENNDTILAVNGDYYGFRNSGFVLRNGSLYRDTSSGTDALVIDENGDFTIVSEDDSDAEGLLEGGAWQVLSFGPALVQEGEIAVDASSEVTKSMNSNPRTAIGQISELHYIFIVSDGRTDESEGLSLLQLAEQFESRGCEIAYNLDGGGSSTMYFNGEIVNNPTNGRSSGEREVSDIVYIGY